MTEKEKPALIGKLVTTMWVVGLTGTLFDVGVKIYAGTGAEIQSSVIMLVYFLMIMYASHKIGVMAEERRKDKAMLEKLVHAYLEKEEVEQGTSLKADNADGQIEVEFTIEEVHEEVTHEH